MPSRRQLEYQLFHYSMDDLHAVWPIPVRLILAAQLQDVAPLP